MDLTTIRTIAEKLLGNVRFSCVYLGGSRAVGWSHKSSDVDLFVISDSEPPPPTGFNLDVTVAEPLPSIAISFHDGVRFDVEYWSPIQIHELVARLGEASARDTLSHADMDVLWRLHTARFLLGDRELFDRLQSTVPASSLSREFAKRAVYSAEVRLDDAAGLLASGEPLIAALACREAFARVVDAVLSHTGSPVPPSKWRLRRLREAEGFEELFREYLAVETMAEFVPADSSAWVRSTVLRSRELLREIDV
ncbi:nucleotidyltransferase domain-containing protein [Micromonospora sp. NPDC006766]|uniref:nucleotidyltransferase domain-containing protein n=1 Tax=Micromonospora sp. NPDC006766 TaxID=3154778 RepID=UPI0033E89704